ncbi:glycosyltransferase family 2 protein [Jannaschia marina]|uniref:glycosyltransferase family 2 protein n=1 Tax=Jannaschia marina TaxID=2741674 RepID=UPI0015CA35BB|nr:glycosyltransferase family 2 protein [Jannaschia marina]
MPTPAVSVLMPFHGAAPFLGASIASVCAQTRTDWELMLVADAPGAEARAVARAAAEGDPRIRLLDTGARGPAGRGAAQARNLGLAQARGGHIAFLDADDLWAPEKLERQLAFMAETGATLSHTAYIRASGEHRTRVAARDRLDYAAMLGPNPMGCLTVIYDRHRLGAQPMPELPLQHDYALWLRLVRLGGPARGLDEVLATYRVAPASLSADKRAAVRDIWRVWRREEGLSRRRSAGALWRYAVFSLRHRRGGIGRLLPGR